MNKITKLVHFPKIRLSKLVARSGGISHVAAMENARKNIELMHEQGDEVIMRSIAEINAIVNAPRMGDEFSEEDLSFILIRAVNALRLKEEEAPAAPPAPSKEEALLTEIRDLLKKK